MTIGPLHIDLGHRVGLIGDVHANRAFLETAIGVLADRGATALVQLGDLGLLFSRGDAQHKGAGGTGRNTFWLGLRGARCGDLRTRAMGVHG